MAFICKIKVNDFIYTFQIWLYTFFIAKVFINNIFSNLFNNFTNRLWRTNNMLQVLKL